MKRLPILLAAIGLVLPCCFEADAASSAWRAVILAEGQDLGGVQSYGATIGVGTEEATLPAPPLPPKYSVSMALYSADDTSSLEDIRQAGEESYLWVIGIDPHGNIMPPDARTSTLSWDPAELGDGDFKLREGIGAKGPVVIEDMKAVTSYDVTGTGTVYLTIVFTPQGTMAG